jgi:predicted permease
MTGLTQDLRYAFRGLKRSPGFTILAVLTLALGIGANSAIFSFADATLLRPLRFEEAEQLVQVSETRPPNAGRSRVAFSNFVDWREQNNTFESMAAVTGSGLTMQAPDGTPEQVPTQSVTVDFFRVFRVRALLGRTFVAEDVTPKPNVVVLSERFWRTRFGADPTVVGRALTLNGQAFTVIGVVPASFRILQTSEMWALFSAPPGAPYLRRARFFDVVGRLRPGVTVETARADVRTIAANLATSLPETNTNVSATVDPLAASVVSNELRLTSQVLIGVVLSILLIACANVASLFTVRGIARRREFAVRAALGAGRERIR